MIFPSINPGGTTWRKTPSRKVNSHFFSLPEIQSSPVSRMLQLMEEIPHHFEPIFGPEIEWTVPSWFDAFLFVWSYAAMNKRRFPVCQRVVAGRNPSINCRSNGTCIRWLIAAEMQCSWPSHPRHFQSDHPANSSVKMYKMDATNCPIGKMKARENGIA